MDAVVAAVSSDLDVIFTFKEEQKMAPKPFLCSILSLESVCSRQDLTFWRGATLLL